MSQKGRNKTEMKVSLRSKRRYKISSVKFWLIPDTLNPACNITIDINNWSVKVETDDNKTSTKSEPPSKRIQIDTGIDNVESKSYGNKTFSPDYEELCKVLPYVVSVLNVNNRLDVLLFFYPCCQ